MKKSFSKRVKATRAFFCRGSFGYLTQSKHTTSAYTIKVNKTSRPRKTERLFCAHQFASFYRPSVQTPERTRDDSILDKRAGNIGAKNSAEAGSSREGFERDPFRYKFQHEFASIRYLGKLAGDTNIGESMS